MKLRTSSVRIATVLCTAAIAALGCGGDDDGRLATYPASGKVTVDGKPAEGVEVTFYAVSDAVKQSGTAPSVGTTDADGVYHLETYAPQDGAPAGKYNVTAFWPEPIPPGADEEMYEPPDRLSEKYLDPNTSGLTIEIPEGGGELPTIELE